MKISELKINPNNPQKFNDLKKLENSIKEFPKMMELRPLVVDNNNIVLGGNKRLLCLKNMGYKEIPDSWVKSAQDLTMEEQRRFIIADNVGFGEWDMDLLGEWEKQDLEDWGLELEWAEEIPEAEEDDFAIPDVIETDIVLGDLIEIGEHRLMCGDSTDSDMVAKLMDGEKEISIYTDPPYGINLDGDNSKRGKDTSLMKGGLNLHSFIDDSISYAVDAFNITRIFNCKKEVWWGANYYCHSLPQSNNWLVWDKRVEEKMRNTNSDCELAYVIDGHNSVRIFRHLWNGLIKASEKQERRVHPTQKPIALAQYCFTEYEMQGVILDLFLGSGSTMVAAHQLKRKCYGMELDPKYCQVIIDRMRALEPLIDIKKNGKEYYNHKL